jgi:Fe-S-cluster containining protein
MTQTSRQQRRSAHRDLLKLGRAAFARGLPAQPKRETVLGVALVLKAKLKERDNAHRAAEAAGLALGLVERSLAARPPAAAIACRKGCSYCCHSFVGLTAPEVFRLVDAVRSRRAKVPSAELVLERCRPLRGLSPPERIGRKLPCPLLEDGMCSVYADRPMVCRQTTSLSLEACIDEFEDRNKEAPIPISPLHLAHVGNVHVAMLGALQAAGLPSAAYELSGAVSVALAVPDAEQRWLSGDNIFHALADVPRPTRHIDAVAGKIAEEIAS